MLSALNTTAASAAAPQLIVVVSNGEITKVVQDRSQSAELVELLQLSPAVSGEEARAAKQTHELLVAWGIDKRVLALPDDELLLRLRSNPLVVQRGRILRTADAFLIDLPWPGPWPRVLNENAVRLLGLGSSSPSDDRQERRIAMVLISLLLVVAAAFLWTYAKRRRRLVGASGGIRPRDRTRSQVALGFGADDRGSVM